MQLPFSRGKPSDVKRNAALDRCNEGFITRKPILPVMPAEVKSGQYKSYGNGNVRLWSWLSVK
jgi:hypothetical protein